MPRHREGWHERAGTRTPKIHALQPRVKRTRCDVYVTLEPCSHHGARRRAPKRWSAHGVGECGAMSDPILWLRAAASIC